MDDTPVDSRRSACMAAHPAASRRTVVSSDILVSIVEGLAHSTDITDIDATPGVVRRELLSTPDYDVWMLSWGPAAEAHEHDHEGSASAMHVVRGRIREERRPVDAAPADAPAEVRVITGGATSTLGAADTHALCNADREVAISIHAYSPPHGA